MSIAPDETCVSRPIRPITDGTLTAAECDRLRHDWRCEDGVHSEFLDKRTRDWLVFLAWRIGAGMVTP